MRQFAGSLVMVGATLLLPVPATAAMCYVLLDRNDNVVYRDSYSPIDLSDRGAAERETLRKRGEHLIAMDVERCPAIDYFTGLAGSRTLSVDQVVDGVPVAGAPGARPAPGAASARGAQSKPRTPDSARRNR